MNQDVKQVIAPDGYNFRWNIKLNNVSVYSGLYGGQYTVAQNGRTVGNGYCIYQNINENLFITSGLSKDGQVGVFHSVADLIKEGSIYGYFNNIHYAIREKMQIIDIEGILKRVVGL